MGKAFFITDGYTLEHNIPATEFHEELNIVFRPATQRERAAIGREAIKLSESKKMEQFDAKIWDFIVSHLVEWTDLNGVSIGEINADNCSKLEHHLLGGIYSVVFGDSPAVAKERASDQKN